MSLSRTLRFILAHPLNRGRPLAAIGRFAWWQIRSRIREEVVVPWIGGARLAARSGMTGATGNIYCGLHEYVDMSFVLHTLRPEDLFVDIGANIGSYSILASKVCGARSVAIEPDPDALRALRRNVEVNELSNRVRVVESALGSEEGAVSFTVGRDTVGRVAAEGGAGTRQVSLSRLDTVLGGACPRLIKMDVEGFEAEVIRGAGATLSCPGLLGVISEATDAPVAGLLSAFGLERAYYDPTTRTFSRTPSAYSTNNGLFLRDLDEASRVVAGAPPRSFRGRAL